MNRRFGVLAVVALLGAVAISLLLRLPARTQPGAPAHPEPPPLAVQVEIRDDGVSCVPESCTVGTRADLTIRNRSSAPVSVALTGYEDRVHADSIGAGRDWHGGFVADRPGQQLAWIVNGELRGRFDVLGSHLVEGHR
jgi:hypothetical protein